MPAGLYVFNYHRIGFPDDTDFDPNVFSATEEQFESQLKTITSRFQIINENDAIALGNSSKELSEPYAMITFDDGYIDNFTKSYPILRAMNVAAIFFITTDFVEGEILPWWDEVAWLIRNTQQSSIKLPGMPAPVTIEPKQVGETIKKVLRYFKDYGDISIADKLAEMRALCDDVQPSEEDQKLFMNWDQVKQLKLSGMGIGSHTCSHRVLSHLSSEEQKYELAKSKNLIENRIGEDVVSFAYPVGGVDSYSKETIKIAGDCNYRMAFTFPLRGGIARDHSSRMMEIPRLSLDGDFGYRDIQYATLFARRH